MTEVAARRFKLTVEYDGTAYAGWQLQSNGPSIQGELERAVRDLTGETVRVHGAGRTDAGVHAVGQAAHLDLLYSIPPTKLASALNAHLPKDIAVAHAEAVGADFHAQYSAVGKVYRYRILNRSARGAFERAYAAHVAWALDFEAMRLGSKALVGQHDFSAFTTEFAEANRDRVAEGRREINPVRNMRAIELRTTERYVEIECEANGFLYNMVRCIVGSLIEVGRGKHPPEWMAEVIESRDRKRAGPTAPACGLCLMKVLY